MPSCLDLGIDSYFINWQGFLASLPFVYILSLFLFLFSFFVWGARYHDCLTHFA